MDANLAKEVHDVYIVLRKDARRLELRHFGNLTRGVEPPVKFLEFPCPPEGTLSEGGQLMDFEPGALLQVNATKTSTGEAAFHLANVAPASPTTQLEYEFVLGELGLGVKTACPEADAAFRGQFRTISSETLRKVGEA